MGMTNTELCALFGEHKAGATYKFTVGDRDLSLERCARVALRCGIEQRRLHSPEQRKVVRQIVAAEDV